MKIVIQTKESNTNRLFDFQSDVEIIKSLELQTTELTKKHNKIQKTILQKLG
jgi:site-specific DNA-methyltransferase (adenine-specific)